MDCQAPELWENKPLVQATRSLVSCYGSPSRLIPQGSHSWMRWYCICFLPKYRYADDTTLMAKSQEELKSFSIKVKEQSEKVGLKLNIQKTKIMASRPITSWQIYGKQWKQWETLFGGAPKSLQMVTAIMRLKEACFLEEKLWPT